MTLDTNFNLSPYFDDFDENKNFHRVLFKPSVAVQARELTQLQSILQNQIERFGDNILIEGTIIRGCNFTEINKLAYVKIRDLQGGTAAEGAGQPVNVNLYDGARLLGRSTGIEAFVRTVEAGLESQDPDVNTLYVKYLSTGSIGSTIYKTFSETEEIEVQNFTTGEVIAVVTAAGQVVTNTIGFGYGVTVSDGIIYQKGHFVRVDEQLTIVGKYTDTPDSVVVGFQTSEDIVNSNQDTSLLDNAQGFNNYNAPGADRLKLTPVLVTKTLDEAKEDERFYAIQEYADGKVIRRNRSTQYATIFEQIEKRTKEESGNYIVNDFVIRFDESAANTDLLTAYVGKGLAYIDGKRVELLDDLNVDFPKASTFKTELSQNITTNYGNYIIVDNHLGYYDINTPTEISLYDTEQQAANNGGISSATGTEIGTAKIRGFELHSGTPGEIGAEYKAYIFDVNMSGNNAFSDTRSIVYGTDGQSDVVLSPRYSSIGTLLDDIAELKETKFKKMVYPIGRDAIKTLVTNSTNYVFSRITNVSIATNGSFTIQLTASDEEWEYGDGALNATQRAEFLLVSQATNAAGGYNDGEPIDLSSATMTIDTATKTLTVTNLSTPDAVVASKLYHSVKKDVAIHASKDIVTAYVKIDANNNTSGTYSVGLPDVHSIEGIWKGTAYNEGSPSTEVTSQFSLVKNQKDTFYDLSKIVADRSLSITDADKILVKVKVYQKDISQGDGFFCVDSYPVDDNLVPANNTITTEEIPSYTTEAGEVIYLRDAIDFRPYAANTAAYAASAGAATENPSSDVTFSSATYTPKPNGLFATSYEYYLGRKDYLYLDASGNFTVIQGFPSENPSAPGEPSVGLIIATVNVPAYPSIGRRRAGQLGKPDYGVTFTKRSIRGYTMSDLSNLDKRISNLEYYISLNSLEQSAVNMLISDDNNLTRFKNGIFVDNFKDLSIADVNNTEFAAGINPTRNEITPTFNIVPVALKGFDKSSWTGVADYANTAALLSSTSQTLIEQPYATSFRNCVTDFYNYVGNMAINPVFDTAYDTTTAPDVNFEIDLVTPFVEFTEELANFVPLQTVDVNVDSTRSGRTTTTTTTTTTSTLEVGEGQTNTQNVGEWITDFTFNPFLRSREVQIVVFGLRPNTEHHFFFDEVNVDQYVAQGDITGSVISPANVVRTSGFGETITSDANGVVYAIFRIPESTFYVGDRKLRCIDVDTIQSTDAATSAASATYRGFSFDITRQGLSLSTRMPEFNTDVEVDVNVTSVTRRGRSDPISQTFTIRPEMSDDNVVMITGLDVFFERKSLAGNGITVELRETSNGYPSARVVPFSKVHLTADDVNISDDGSLATTITFDAPVTLKTGAQYAFAIIPDAADPDYRIWISRTGERDVATGLAIASDFSDGTLFTSTNNSAWTPYQNENIKFTLRKAAFSSSLGSIKLTNRDNEFLSLDLVVGDFEISELVGIQNANNAGTIAITTGNNTITGASTTFTSDFEIGDHLAVWADSSTIDFLEVSAIANNTTMTVVGAPRASNTASDYFTTRVGRVSYYNRNTPPKLVLEDSKVKPSMRFEANTSIVGETSGATAFITEVVDQNVSYLQTNIQRTNFAKTTNTLQASTLTDSTDAEYSRILSFNTNNYLTDYPTVVKSRSNEIAGGITNGTEKSFVFTMSLENSSTALTKSASPFVDYGISGVNLVEFLVNNPTSNFEETIDGDANAKYISKKIELASDLDADDLKVYLSAYRPIGTNIEVYSKFHSQSDGRQFSQIPWTKLDMKAATTLFSSSSNIYDYREFEFDVPRVDSPDDLTDGGSAALDKSNSNVITYKDDNGAVYSRYLYFSLKIVMLADSHRNVPKLKDVRGIALS